jgi:hypothetical protein
MTHKKQSGCITINGFRTEGEPVNRLLSPLFSESLRTAYRKYQEEIMIKEYPSWQQVEASNEIMNGQAFGL